MIECAGRANGWDNGRMALEEAVDLKLDHRNQDGIEIVDVEGEIDVYTAPRLRELYVRSANRLRVRRGFPGDRNRRSRGGRRRRRTWGRRRA